MIKPKQLYFQNIKTNRSRLEFGGELLNGKRKSKRPISTRKPIHLVLRASEDYSRAMFSPTYSKSWLILKKTAKQFNVKIYELAFNITHIHLLIQFNVESDYIKFIRVLTCRFAFAVRSRINKKIKIFMHRPYTRIVSWGIDWSRVRNYILKNQNESGVLRQIEIYEDTNLESG
jgi:REP element-mobilizing transposase RayT